MTLLETIHECGLTERLALNMLTERRMISDHVVNAEDVAEPDATKAKEWLKENFGELCTT